MPNEKAGLIRNLIANVEIWHLNTAAAVFVVIFVYVQFRTMFTPRLTAKQLKNSSFTDKSKTEKKKKFVDKEAGDSLDLIDDHDDFTLKNTAKEIPYIGVSYGESEMLKRSQLFYESMKLRRSVRTFSSKQIPLKLIQNLIKTAGTAPSGANMQPWTFCVIGTDAIKKKIREIVEYEEQINYSRRMGAKWVLDVAHLHVNWNKPYLTEAPFLIVIMKHTYEIDKNDVRQPTYYAESSTCIAVGILLTAIQNAGLVTVTTTPLNAGGQIRELLQRPSNEKVVLLLPVGYPANGTHVPDIKRKPLEEIIRLY